VQWTLIKSPQQNHSTRAVDYIIIIIIIIIIISVLGKYIPVLTLMAGNVSLAREHRNDFPFHLLIGEHAMITRITNSDLTQITFSVAEHRSSSSQWRR